ncbi:hypothetical protein [uncultured Pseudoalteromonas sp.]|jgi:hypothetical protein|uniref:hypothetical protein n=1 Tax=Pseudoalteromonas tetraodonis TaxID=43659 RepID=UPI0032B2D676
MKLFDPTVRVHLSPSNSAMDEFIFLDIEASGLSFSSYPIEVAYASSRGRSGAYLIKPSNQWIENGEWDKTAEQKIHMLSIQLLNEQGMDSRKVACSLNEALKGSIVFCSDLAYDGPWLTQLFESANVGVEFSLTDIEYFFEWLGNRSSKYKEELKKIAMPEHRALSDAQRFVDTYLNLATTSQ